MGEIQTIERIRWRREHLCEAMFINFSRESALSADFILSLKG
jgi:hypothetical protein